MDKNQKKKDDFKIWFFEKINKGNKTLARLINEQRTKTSY